MPDMIVYLLMRSLCLDTTNVNYGPSENDLKLYLVHKVPLLPLFSRSQRIGCNNVKIALLFKHLRPPFKCVAIGRKQMYVCFIHS